MSSDTVAIRVAGIQGNVLEFWAAQIPESERAPPMLLGVDHPAFALMVIAGAANGNNALSGELGDQDITDSAWLQARTGDFITSMTLVGDVRLPWVTPKDLWNRAVATAGSFETTLEQALLLAPRALYQVTVANPDWLEHLRPGQHFGSTAYTPFPPVLREATRSMVTPGAWEPLNAVMRMLPDPARAHLTRNAVAPGQWISGAADEATRAEWSHRARELAARRGGGMFVYYDVRAPRFNASKCLFKEGNKPISSAEARLLIAAKPNAPQGFDCRVDTSALRHPDGVARVRLNTHIQGGKIAWLDVEGEPLVRTGTYEGVDPRSPATDVDAYLLGIAEQVRREITA